MARAVIGGLLSSTFITLVLVPVLYWLMESYVLPFLRRLWGVCCEPREAESGKTL